MALSTLRGLDPEVTRLIRQYDIHYGADLWKPEKCNILLTDLQLRNGQIEGTIMESALRNHWEFDEPMKPERRTNRRARFSAPSDQNFIQFLLQQEKILLFNVQLKPPVGDDAGNFLQLGFVDTTVIYPWTKGLGDENIQLNFCSGGFGGWSHGRNFLTKQGFSRCKTGQH